MSAVSYSKSLLALIAMVFAWVFSAPALAKTFEAKLDQSQWYASSSIFECSLIHEIPLYGRGVFFHEAGEDLSFYTTSVKSPMKPGRGALVIEGSGWKPGAEVRDLGYVDVTDSDKPIRVGSKSATAMMDGLLEGMAPTFTRKAWYKDESIRVRINSINFDSVYSTYLECLAGLLPVNFRQVEKTRVNFTVDKADLTPSDIKKLDMVVLYVNADPSVTAIYVDGHTDSSGRRIYNRRLSKSRAEAVTQFLIRKGLPEEQIRTRYHGERYPAVKNNTKANKAINRRTTVRLVRGEELPELDEETNVSSFN